MLRIAGTPGNIGKEYMQEMMDWVDIKDKLPDHEQKVRCKGHFPFETDCEFRQVDKGYLFMIPDVGRHKICIEINGVTHWKNQKKI